MIESVVITIALKVFVVGYGVLVRKLSFFTHFYANKLKRQPLYALLTKQY